MSFPRTTRAALTAMALLAALLLTSNVMLAAGVVITSNTDDVSQTYSGVTHDLSQLSSYVYVTISQGSVSGTGLTIKGTSTSSSTEVGVSYIVNGGTMTAPIEFTDGIVPNSAFVFSAITVTMSSANSNAFLFTAGTFTSNTTFTFHTITATWDSVGTGALVSTGTSFDVTAKSAIFIEKCTVSKANSVLSVSGSAYSARVNDGSVVAIDETTCTGCGTALTTITLPLTVSASSLFRVSGCDAGAALLVSDSNSVTVSDQSLYIIMSSTSTGTLFSYTGSSFTVSGLSVATFRALVGSSTGVLSSSAIPTWVSTDSATYGDDGCKFGNVAMTSTDTFLSNGLRVGNFLTSAQCSKANCIPGTSTDASSGSSSCTCVCTDVTYPAFCTYMKDPQYDLSGGVISCQLFKCIKCAVPTKCDACETGYKVDSTTNLCVIACPSNCAECDNKGTCTLCEANYTPVNGGCVECKIDHCLRCKSPNVCDKCKSPFELVSNSKQCVCPEHCVSCSDRGCSECDPGYRLTDDNTCVSTASSVPSVHGALAAALVCVAVALLALVS